jgi:hypothetical protein
VPTPPPIRPEVPHQPTPRRGQTGSTDKTSEQRM